MDYSSKASSILQERTSFDVSLKYRRFGQLYILLLLLLHWSACLWIYVGELSVEVLEAEGLRRTDVLTGTDAYAIVVFEGFAAITVWVNNSQAPRWPHDAARAFRFIFAGAEVDVVARSVAERDLWLLAVQSLPIGAAYLGKVEIVSKFDAYADTGCEGTAISRRRAKG